MKIEIDRSPAKADRDMLSQGIMAFNEGAVPDLEPVDDEVAFHLFARDEAEIIQGGIRASCYWNTLHIELLWLSKAARGGGVGRTLLAKAEAFAREQGCENAFVETTSWQARPFYERHGYH
ncbi:MAG: GNAT family N-acetyltransferase, partial [Pacificimonas sp.]